jgi:alcohol dehydrogenase class IV
MVVALSSKLNNLNIVEATYVKDANPIMSILVAKGIRSLANTLPRIMTDPSSLTARSLALFGVWRCRKCLATTSVALHHKLLCYVLGGSFNLPHATILPHEVTYNAPNISETMKALEEVIPNNNGLCAMGMDSYRLECDGHFSQDSKVRHLVRPLVQTNFNCI